MNKSISGRSSKVTSEKLRKALASRDDLSEQFFESLLESAPDAMIIVDEYANIAIVNGQAEEMFGYTRDEMHGETIELLLPDRFRDRHVNHRNAYSVSPNIRPMGLGMELYGSRKDGTEFPVEISLSPVKTGAGTFVASVIRDVTQRKEMESALIEARQEAERANRANSAFLAAASHDLRQPVQALSLLNGALRRTVSGEKALHMLDSQNKSLAAMTNLLNSLLDISRLDAGAVKPEIEDFPISRLFEQLSSEFSRQAMQKGLTFDSEHGGGTVRTDSNMLTEIVQNFVSNSIRYTNNGGVRLQCSQADGVCRIEVRDTGIGIDADQLDKIFTAFHQCKAPGTSQEGFGLGLAIVSRLAELLGHEITVESTPGEGSCFCVSVPLVDGCADDAEAAADAGNKQNTEVADGTVILIEDDQQVAGALTMLLEGEGYTVAVASTKKEAVDVVKQLSVTPDLLISDFHLADTSNGVQAIAAIRRDLDMLIPALIITGDTSRVVDEARSVSNCTLLNKPIDPDRLLELARTATTTGSAEPTGDEVSRS